MGWGWRWRGVGWGKETGTENDLPHRGSPWPLSSHFSSLGSFFSPLPLTNEEETPWTLMVSHLSSWIPQSYVRYCTMYVCCGVEVCGGANVLLFMYLMSKILFLKVAIKWFEIPRCNGLSSYSLTEQLPMLCPCWGSSTADPTLHLFCPSSGECWSSRLICFSSPHVVLRLISHAFVPLVQPA